MVAKEKQSRIEKRSNLCLMRYFLATGTESHSKFFRASGSTVEKHDHAERKGILFFPPRLIKVEIASSLWSLSSWKRG